MLKIVLKCSTCVNVLNYFPSCDQVIPGSDSLITKSEFTEPTALLRCFLTIHVLIKILSIFDSLALQQRIGLNIHNLMSGILNTRDTFGLNPSVHTQTLRGIPSKHAKGLGLSHCLVKCRRVSLCRHFARQTSMYFC